MNRGGMDFFWLFIAFVGLLIVYVVVRSMKNRQKQERMEANNPYHGSIHTTNGIDLNYDVSAREKTPDEQKAAELLKEATQKKYDRDFDGAISCLRKAYELLARSATIYPIETYLRLPLYLQKSGRYKESLVEFKKLLSNNRAKIHDEFSHCSTKEQEGLSAMECSITLDKMRLAAQREKQFTYAVYCQLLCEASGAVGLKLQGREKEFSDYGRLDFWTACSSKLIKRAAKESIAKELADVCLQFSKLLSNSALEKLSSDLAELLEIRSPLSGFSKVVQPIEATQAEQGTVTPQLRHVREKNETPIRAEDVSEIVYNFTQRHFIEGGTPEAVDLSCEDALFSRLAQGPISQAEVYQLPTAQRRLLRELLTQYIMFFEMNRQLPFPPAFLQDSSQDQLGPNLLEYICHYRWPFPQALSR
jgi:hypothetical protein